MASAVASSTVQTSSHSPPKSLFSARGCMGTSVNTSPDISTLAAEVGLQDQVKECLVAVGLDTISALAELKDVDIIEKFLRENHSSINPIKFKDLYGLYECSPEEFKFVPGHLLGLEALIKRCIEVHDQFQEQKDIQVKTLAPNNMEITENMQVKFSAELRSETTRKCIVSNAESNAHITLIQNKTYDDIKKKLNVWCQSQTQIAISRMQLNKQYKIQVLLKCLDNCTANENGEIESKLNNLNANFVCMACCAKLKLHLRTGSFTIANATRHILRCVPISSSGNNLSSTVALPDIWTLAAEVGLQGQVKECLVASGFDTIQAIVGLKDVNIIEQFLRENHSLMKPLKLNHLYGFYQCSPERFKFVPGHLLRLEALIKRCIEVYKQFQEQKEIHAKILKNSKENSNKTEIPEPCEMPRPKRKCKISVAEPNPPITLILNETYDDIKKKLHFWCQSQTQTAITQMQLNKHYKLQVLKKRFDNCTTDENGKVENTVNNLLANFVCIACGTKLKLHSRKGSFTIANATRHILRCIQSSASGRKSKIKQPRRLTKLMETPEVLQQPSETISEIPGEQHPSWTVQCAPTYTAMSSENRNDISVASLQETYHDHSCVESSSGTLSEMQTDLFSEDREDSILS